jgi:diadenosine tetraphosphate (Ap4A) HIT family hydrolase
MPTLIPRQEALDRIRAEGGAPPCLMCAIRDGKVGDRHELHDRDGVFAFLPRYVRRWGQVTVMPHAHVTSYVDVDPALWAETSRVAFHFARAVERALKPRRVYLASTGSSAGKELVQTSEHLHIHVIPIYEPDDRPADIFSWREGVYVGTPDEWRGLRASLVEAVQGFGGLER